MTWKMSEKPRTVLANKGLIQEFVEMEPVPHDRPLSERRMQVYGRILNAGDFRTAVWASVLCLETNSTFRVNGKHTSLLLAGLNPTPEFHVTVERYTADTLQDVANLYNTFDSALATRSASDINKAFAATVSELRDIPLRLINLTVAAAAEEKWEEAVLRKVPPAERAEELMENIDFVQWLYKIMPGGGADYLKGEPQSGERGSVAPIRRGPVVRGMLATYKRSPQLATKFWTEVRDETAMDRNDSTRVLARFLIRASIGGGGNSTVAAGKKMVSKRELYVKCLLAWNAWRKGETRTALNYHINSPIPPVVK